MDGTDSAARLRHVFADQRFPAARWELVTEAEAYGADARTRDELRALPGIVFRSIEHVIAMVTATHGEQPAVPGGCASPRRRG